MSLWSASGVPDERLQHLARLRLHYDAAPLRRSDMPQAPGEAFADWFAAAEAAGVIEPNAMVLATAGEDGLPSARTVLLKGVEPSGFSFFTNYQSRKGRQLAAHPRASLLFVWLPLFRQISITGHVARLSAEQSDEYFASRPRGSQLAAWASAQSSQVSGRADLERAWQTYESQFADGPVPRPPHWGGFEVRPLRIEFWQGQPSRMHDRIVYEVRGQSPEDIFDPAAWQRSRLAP